MRKLPQNSDCCIFTQDAAVYIRLDINELSVEKKMDCFVSEVHRSPGQEFCFYISSGSYLCFHSSCQRTQQWIYISCFHKVVKKNFKLKTHTTLCCLVKAVQISSAPKTKSFPLFPPIFLPLSLSLSTHWYLSVDINETWFDLSQISFLDLHLRSKLLTGLTWVLVR